MLLLAGAVLAVSLAFLVSRLVEANTGTITFEFYKLLMQALLIGAVGACLSAAIQEARRRRDADERQRTFRRERIESLLHDIEEDYRLVKRSRRMLRLERPIRYSSYRAEMINLEDIQRSFEELEANISKLDSEQGFDLATVTRNVTAMKKYVEALWSEYEEIAASADQELPPEKLAAVTKFVADSETGSFHRMKTSYRAVRLELLGQLATLAGSSSGESDGPD